MSTPEFKPVYYMNLILTKPVVVNPLLCRNSFAHMLENVDLYPTGRLVEVTWGGHMNDELGHTLVQFCPRTVYTTALNFRNLDETLRRWVLGPEAPSITKTATLFLGPTIQTISDECFDALVKWIRNSPLKFHHVFLSELQTPQRLVRLGEAVLQSGHGVFAIHVATRYDPRAVWTLANLVAFVPTKDRFWRIGLWGTDLTSLPTLTSFSSGPEVSRREYATTRFDTIDVVLPWVLQPKHFQFLAQAFPAVAQLQLERSGYHRSAELVARNVMDPSELATSIGRLFRVPSDTRVTLLGWKQCARDAYRARQKTCRETCDA